MDEPSQKFKNKSADSLKTDAVTSKQEKLRQKNKGFIVPESEEVKKYFQKQNYLDIEAQKFYNYFSSNGWLLGGKIQMVDWKASAENWMLNSSNFKPYHHHNTDKSSKTPKHLNTPTDKNYSEPL